MRPPSYYSSLVGSNSTNYNSSSAAYQNSSYQLRSSFSSPTSSSYASRTHLPYVAPSVLIAHCFSTGSSANSYASHRSASRASNYSSTPGAYSSYSSTGKRLAPAPSSSSALPSSSGAYLSSSRRQALARPTSYVPSASTRSSYRPNAGSYYKPIRLRERPLLTQLRHQPQAPATPERRPSAALQPSVSGATSVGRDTDPPEAPSGATDELWSRDVARNISRNKYLIKFREFDKRRPTLSPIDLNADNPAQQLDNEQPKQTGGSPAVESRRQARDLSGANELLESVAPTDGGKHTSASKSPERDEHKPNETVARSETVEAESKRQDGELASATKDNAGGQTKEEPSKKAPIRRRNVKLKLKPASRQQTAKVVASESSETTRLQALEKPAGGGGGGAGLQAEVVAPSERPVSNETGKLAVERKLPAGDVAGGAPSDEQTQQPQTPPSSKLQENKAKPKRKKKNKEIELSKAAEASGPAGVAASPPSEPTATCEPALTRTIAQPAGVPAAAGVIQKRIKFREYQHDDFNFLTVLGHGGWGFVVLAELKGHDACFAVKCIKKMTIVEDDDFDSIMIERKMLALGNVHPFICKLFCTFETPGYLFFVMEFCPGGDLMFHVQHETKFDEPRCRFYAAEIICAIRFLHNKHIIYRDLKLDNILLDARGHIRLVDFGMCQCRTYREEMLPSNFCGTPEYISPEIIKGVPYNHSVDWWSFGVLLYEMAVGKMPFRGQDENELLWNVCYEQIHYPMFLSKDLASLLQQLLEREPSKRMGMATCKSGDIQDQPFFRSVDWRAIEELRVQPPFVPEVNSGRDVRNFDTDFTESACELSPVDESTLAKIDQTQFQQFPYTNPSIEIFEHQYRA